MRAASYIRRIAFFVCLAAVLLAALTPGMAGLPFAILVPLLFFIAIVLSVPLPCIEEQTYTPQAFALPVFSPRPPPKL
jgi:hypothetical protein